MRPKLKDKRWNLKHEARIRRKWEREGIYTFNPRSRKKLFVIDTPPPYPSGRWHLAAVTQYSQIDMIARTARMRGFEVMFPIGIDRNGIPVEIFTERRYNLSMHETPRARFIGLCRTALDELEAEMIGIMKSIGMSGDFERYYRTDCEAYRALTQATFIELWKKGLIYEATRPNNWCVKLRTTLADAEVVYQEFEAQLVYIKFMVKETGEELVVATTRPELLCACQAIIVHPKDRRYEHLHDKHALLPIYEREVPIIPHPEARPEFGTGAAMVCSYGDYSDVRLFRELGLEEIKAIDLDGKMTEATGRYAGLDVEQARKEVVNDLRQEGLVVRVERIRHRVPVGERSGAKVEIIPMREWYLRQVEFKDRIRKRLKDMEFHPKRHAHILLNWMDSITTDWPISRRRYYGTEIPIWYCESCGKPNLPKPGRYYQPWRERPPFKSCRFCGSKDFDGEERTFDTWFDSSISPLFVTAWPNPGWERLYASTIRPQGYDIVRTWLWYSLLRCFQLTKRLPFRHVWIGGMGVDEHGEKMSKSKGNVLYPEPFLRKYGADAFRFWNASEASLGSNFRCSERRIRNAAKFLTKLWNVARFISQFPLSRAKPLPLDEWILAELNETVRRCLKGYEDFNFFIPSNEVRGFIWGIFAPHYLELIKPRAYGIGFSKTEQRAAWATLHRCLRTILLLLAPITPFMTDHIWRELYGRKSVHLQALPSAGPRSKFLRYTKPLLDFNSFVWKAKKEKGISLKEGIELRIPRKLRIFASDLIAAHNIV